MRRWLTTASAFARTVGQRMRGPVSFVLAAVVVLAFVGVLASHAAPHGTTANVAEGSGTPTATVETTQTPPTTPTAPTSLTPVVGATPASPGVGDYGAATINDTQPGHVFKVVLDSAPNEQDFGPQQGGCSSANPFLFTAQFWINPSTQPTTITYRWVRSDGWTATDSLTIPAGKQANDVTTSGQMTWNMPGALGDGSQRAVTVEALSPNDLTSKPAYAMLTCENDVTSPDGTVTPATPQTTINTLYDCGLASQTYTFSQDLVAAPSPGGYSLSYHWTTTAVGAAPVNGPTQTVTVAPDQGPIHTATTITLQSTSARGTYTAQLVASYRASDGSTAQVFTNPLGVDKFNCPRSPPPHNAPSSAPTTPLVFLLVRGAGGAVVCVRRREKDVSATS